MNHIEQAIDSVIEDVATKSYNVGFNSQQKKIDELKKQLDEQKAFITKEINLLDQFIADFCECDIDLLKGVVRYTNERLKKQVI